nr:MAG TPA: hypothetical protein [Caudoviricetes sp.]DAG77481.1 MAG TPA: hypothetical protein [Caudoviricetes sp.]
MNQALETFAGQKLLHPLLRDNKLQSEHLKQIIVVLSGVFKTKVLLLLQKQWQNMRSGELGIRSFTRILTNNL